MSEQTFLVTGANTGIGKATAEGLARQGGRVYVAARSAEKGEAAVAGIKAAAGSSAVFFLALDLADLSSVRDCAAEFLARGEPLHVLINNAGVAGRRGLTKQGFELMFGVNHLGHFLLTQLLLERLVSSAPARVVTVSTVAAASAMVAVPANRTTIISGATTRQLHRLAMLTIAAAFDLRGECTDRKRTAMPPRLNEPGMDIPRL